jgi:hypothetical protein
MTRPTFALKLDWVTRRLLRALPQAMMLWRQLRAGSGSSAWIM